MVKLAVMGLLFFYFQGHASDLSDSYSSSSGSGSGASSLSSSPSRDDETDCDQEYAVDCRGFAAKIIENYQEAMPLQAWNKLQAQPPRSDVVCTLSEENNYSAADYSSCIIQSKRSLEQATFLGTNFSNAILCALSSSDNDFANSNLVGAYIVDSRLFDANFEAADFSNAFLLHVKTNASFKSAQFFQASINSLKARVESVDFSFAR
jgi:uncharacterized protein YjbI with pentapeptide repeats